MPILLGPSKEKIIPVIAIRETIVFPHVETVLSFGRPKSIAGIEAAYKTDQLVCFFTQKYSKSVDPGQNALYEVGTLAKVERLLYSGKSGMNAWIKGLRRVKLESIEAHKPFLLGKVVEIPEVVEEGEEIKALSKTIMEHFQRAINLGKTVDFMTIMRLMEGSATSELADQISYVLDLETGEKQKLLETFSVKERLKKDLQFLINEIKVLELEKEIDSKAQSHFDKSMKEAVLRERKRAIEEELGDLSGEDSEVKELETKIYDAVGHEFNINSPHQLGIILFDDLKLPTSKRGKARYSTEAAVLEELRGAHPVIDLILEVRQLTKLKSTYVDALPSLINPRTGRVHTSFNQTRTATGRLSSTDPNLQNIPIRGELGRHVRRAFIASPGSYLLAGDYSQIDLRVLAHLSQDEELLRAFRADEDIHSDTASKLFGVEPSQVTADMRRLAKTVNFGVIYGMSEYGLEQATKLSREEAGRFIDAYFEKHPGVKRYLDSTKEHARKFGFVQTLLGRRRYIPEINSANRIVREAAERMAINMPVQGTSADIIKVAMIDLCREMDARRLESKILLQVHDELVFEVPQAEIDIMAKLVPELMAEAVKLSVPVKVDVKTGTSWGQME